MKSALLPLLAGLLLFTCPPQYLAAQIDTLPVVLISANKWEQNQNEIPNKITRVSRQDIFFQNPQTTADLLGNNGSVYIQKSQLGGGSPMIRGVATNRILIVVDGVRMNNAIYRSGNLQNVISIDPLSLKNAEVIFGPGSLTYGSDAIGGVMDFHTLDAPTTGISGKKTIIRGNAFLRGSTADQEKTAHADINIGFKKWALLGSATFSGFDDLKMGKHGGQDSYLRPEYVERINNKDSIVVNSDPRRQVASGYDQLNLLQKIHFVPSDKLSLQYTFQYAGSTNAPRYDRLIEYRNNRLRYADWYYGPQLWRSHNLQIFHRGSNVLYDKLRLVAAYQHYEESRNDRSLNSNSLRTQTEKVGVLTLNANADKHIGKSELFYGLEAALNNVNSYGQTRNINDGTITEIASRYPNGSHWNSYAVYGSYKWNFHPQFTFAGGLRYSYTVVNSTFDSRFFKFPYDKAEINDGGLTGSAGLVFRPGNSWQINGNISTGFRVPNIDDLGKLFESTPGNLTVPNPALKSEYAWNFELGIAKRMPGKIQFELTGFYTLLDNAIVRRPFTFHGQDSIEYDGTLSRVEALQNAAHATIWGIEAFGEAWIVPSISIFSTANYIDGKETDDTKDQQVALRHAPPFFGSTGFRYKRNKVRIEGSVQYNSEISNKNLAPSEQAKPLIYAKDADGKPYSPAWYTINLKGSYTITDYLILGMGWENITNQRYRPYSSGIVAAGSNFIVSLRASF